MKVSFEIKPKPQVDTSSLYKPQKPNTNVFKSPFFFFKKKDGTRGRKASL
jgi:hypothetical protein